MKKTTLVLMLLLMLLTSCGDNKIMPIVYEKYSTPDIKFYTDSKKLLKDFESEFKTIKDGFDLIDSIPYEERTVKNTLYAMDELFSRLDFPEIGILAYVSPDKDLRDASLKCREQISGFFSSFILREKTYKALKDLKNKYHGKLSPNEERWLNDEIDYFEREGIQLEEAKRLKLYEINKELSKLSIDFAKNLREEDSSITISEEDLEGVPETALERMEKDKDGKYILKTDYPTYSSVMMYSNRSDTKKQYYELFQNRGYPENIAILEKITHLKKEKADILGYSSIRELLLSSKMAKTPETVDSFLENLVGVISDKAASDRNILKEANNGKEVNSWDTGYLSNKIKMEKYNVDQEKIREYFSLETAINGCMNIYEELFSIKFAEDESAAVWHPDVKKYNVMSEGKAIAAIYLDLFPRENKYTHAAQFVLRGGRLISENHYESPVVALVCNFAKPTEDKPSLLSLNEVTTFFHEFGHGMHSCLTTAKLNGQAGTSVRRDFVETPSQMFELWLEKPEILNRFARHYKTGSPMPEDLINNIVKLNYFLKAHNVLSQVFLGMYDQAIHGQVIPDSTTKLWADMKFDITKYKTLENTHPEASFNHIVSGYSAGYYSYLWAEVMSVDMFDRFESEGLMNPDTGMEYRVKVLSKGDSIAPELLVRDFLGRDSNAEAFTNSLRKDSL